MKNFHERGREEVEIETKHFMRAQDSWHSEQFRKKLSETTLIIENVGNKAL